MVNSGAETAGPEEMNTVQIRYIDAPCIRWGQSEPYSCTCIPKKHTSTPSISSKAKSALVRYGKDSDISPESTNLDFIPGLTSTVLSELATTLTKPPQLQGDSGAAKTCSLGLPNGFPTVWSAAS